MLGFLTIAVWTRPPKSTSTAPPNVGRNMGKKKFDGGRGIATDTSSIVSREGERRKDARIPRGWR
jgi:hypothetical protein